jgi:hypothetical protein
MPVQRLGNYALLPLAAALLFAGVPAASAQDEPTAVQRFLGTLGILEIPDENAPDYRERAPLVVPPAQAETQLPPPRNPEDAARQVPDWPVDQDIQRRKAAAKEKRVSSSVRDEDFFTGRLLSRDQLNRGTARTGTGGAASNTAGAELAAGRERYSPSQLGFKGWFNRDKPVVFTEEPERARLTDPPSGYRTPSASAPYGIVETKQKNRLGSVFDRLDAGQGTRQDSNPNQ